MQSFSIFKVLKLPGSSRKKNGRRPDEDNESDVHNQDLNPENIVVWNDENDEPDSIRNTGDEDHVVVFSAKNEVPDWEVVWAPL